MFRKIDLHIHTPYSSCYLDHVMPESSLQTSPADIIKAALEAGLEAIAITDHNSVAGLNSLRLIAKERGLCLFPGVELSLKGGHVLAIFDVDQPASEINSLISHLGFSPEQQGQGFVESELWLDYAFQKIEELGGLAIAAHVDRKPKGFIASEEIQEEDKRRILSSPHLAALEITIQSSKALWNQGTIPGYPRKIACIQGSDAHAPNEIGRRPAFVDLPSFNLEGLRIALAEYSTRIKFPQEL